MFIVVDAFVQLELSRSPKVVLPGDLAGDLAYRETLREA